MAADPASRGGRRGLHIGKYEVLAHLATGGMGAVYRARDVELGRDVALKILPPEMAVKPNMLERFRREARSAARLRHENIVTLYEFGESTGTYFLALEFVEGIDLHEYINQKGRLKAELAKSILVQAVRALDHAHRQGIVHRDIKPSNFLIIPQDGEVLVKLTDFGLAQARDDEEARAAEFRLTKAGTTVGTVDYMAPEQARNSSAADIRSDIYSLGCTFYHMLAGNCPFPEGSLTERIFKHIEAEPPDVRRLNPDVPAGLVVILQRMLEKNPEDRYQTPFELLLAIEDPKRLEGYRYAEDAPLPLVDAITPEPAAAEPLLKPRAKKPATETVAGPVKGKSIGKRRLRDDDDDEADASPEKPARLSWPWVTAAAGLLLVAGLIVLVLSQQNRQAPTTTHEIAAATTKRPTEEPETTTKKLPIKIIDPIKKPDPIEPKLPLLYKPAVDLDLPRLHDELEGPFAKLPQPIADAVVYRVRRLPPAEPDWFSSLGEACAKAPEGQRTIVELHDNGPLFEPALPPLQNRHLIIRAGKGYRPLVAWDVGAQKSNRFLALEKGSLTLENLDIVVKWSDDRATEAATLFHITGGDFFAQQCTFSIAGKHPNGIHVVRLETPPASSRCCMRRCYFRGSDFTTVSVRGSGADVFLENCVVAGGDAPLFDLAVADASTTTVRLIRSTLVAGKTLARVTSRSDAASKPAVQWYLWDVLLARSGPPIDAELLQLGAGVGSDKMSWRVVNSLYTGWEKLLTTGAKTIAATALDKWREQWRYDEGDKVMLHVWPKSRPTDPEDVAAELYTVDDSPVCFQATSWDGPIGCDLTTLPAARSGWLALTYERYLVQAVELTGGETVPAIPAAINGLYVGERLELTKKNDLGKHLQTRLESAKPGPRIVLHLHGEGEHITSPIRIKGSDLVLYFEPAKPKARPLVLEPNPTTVADREALIEVEDGNLELIGARIVFANQTRAALPKRMIKVRGGDLRLYDCHLEGPLAKAPPAYQGLIHFAGSGKEPAEQARICAIQQSILLSGKTLLSVQGTGARLRWQQSLFVAVADLLRFDLGTEPPARLNLQCALDHNTFAVRGAFFALSDVPAVNVTEPLVIHADANAFLDPFVEVPRQASLVRCDGALLARGTLLWQGKGNAYDDKRLQAYLTPAGGDAPENQAHAVWSRAWGSAGEQQPLFLNWPATPPSTFSQDKLALERLRLPPEIRNPVGADLYRLRILSKKK